MRLLLPDDPDDEIDAATISHEEEFASLAFELAISLFGACVMRFLYFWGWPHQNGQSVGFA